MENKPISKKARIAIIRCSGALNLGNEFINAGGEVLVKTCFSSSTLYYFEYFDSCIIDSYSYPSKAFTDSSLEFINNCDIIILFGGSIISKYMIPLFEQLKILKPIKFLIGASLYMYNDEEKRIATKLFNVFDFIVTRDHVTYQALGNKERTLNGIDLAFLIDKNKICAPERGGYHLINLDLIQDNKDEIKKFYNDFVQSRHTAYIIENTTNTHRDIEGYVFLSYWESLYGIIANAESVITNKIHTSLVCMKNGVGFTYKGDDQGGKSGRNTLFNEIGFCLENKEYSKDIVAGYSYAINARIKEFYYDFYKFIISQLS